MAEKRMVLYFEKIIVADEDLADDIGEDIEDETGLEYTGYAIREE